MHHKKILCPVSVSAQFPAGGNFRQKIWIILTSDTLRLELTNSQSQPQNGVTFSTSDMIDSPQNIYILHVRQRRMFESRTLLWAHSL